MSETATATQAITLNPALWEYPVIAPSSLYPLDQTEVTVVIKAGKPRSATSYASQRFRVGRTRK